MPEAEAEEVIETFILRVADVTFHDRIHARHFYARTYDRFIRVGKIFENRIKAIRVYPIIVPDQVTEVEALVLDPHTGVDSLMSAPIIVGRKGCWTHPNAAGAVMDKDEDVCVEPAEQRKHATFAKSIWKNKENVLNFVDWRITTSRLECLNGMFV